MSDLSKREQMWADCDWQPTVTVASEDMRKLLVALLIAEEMLAGIRDTGEMGCGHKLMAVDALARMKREGLPP